VTNRTMASINKEASDAERWIASTWDLTPEMTALAREVEKARLADIKHAGQQGRNKSFPAFVQHGNDNPDSFARIPGFTGIVFSAIWRRIMASVAVHPASK